MTTQNEINMHLQGRAITVLHLMGEAYDDQMKKLRKKMEDAGLPLKDLDADVALSRDILAQAGYSKTGEKGRVESTEGQGTLPLGEPAPVVNARITCVTCSRMFAVPPGDNFRECPDCGTIHRVKADAHGEVFRRIEVKRMPVEVLDLVRRKMEGGKLTSQEEAKIAAWTKENPDHLPHDATVKKGDRLADPSVPGSGNPLHIDCARTVGNACDGFDATDTPGTAGPCPKCGHKFTVKLLNGAIFVKQWDASDDAPSTDASEDGGKEDGKGDDAAGSAEP